MSTIDKHTDWLFQLKRKTPLFLEKLKGKKRPGFYHYSLSGDLYGEDVKWGLGNTVFATKIYYVLDLLKNLPERESMANFIKSFQRNDGTLFDPLVRKKAILGNLLSGVLNLNFSSFTGKQTVIAETRQSISALKLLEVSPSIPYQNFPKTNREIEKYLKNLNWRRPWNAGSHFSHLLFFLTNSQLIHKENLVESAINLINRIQSSEDGSWYLGNPSLQQKINGAMKIITGLNVTDKLNLRYPEKLIDLCIQALNDSEACDNFNIVYVLRYASRATNNDYRFDEIKQFVLKRLNIYRKYYFLDIGGFSFFPDKANVYYYDAKITRGLKEPDIHGTVMFLLGISIIAKILDINDKLGFNEVPP